jgi:hypothetical protein
MVRARLLTTIADSRRCTARAPHEAALGVSPTCLAMESGVRGGS